MATASIAPLRAPCCARPSASRGRAAVAFASRPAPAPRVLPALRPAAGLVGTPLAAVGRPSPASRPGRRRGAVAARAAAEENDAPAPVKSKPLQEEKNLTAFYNVLGVHYLLWAWPTHLCDLCSTHFDLRVLRLEGPLQIASFPIRYTDYPDFPWEWQMATIAWCLILPIMGVGLLRRTRLATYAFLVSSVIELTIWQNNFWDPSGQVRERTWVFLFIIGAWGFLQVAELIAKRSLPKEA